MRKQTKLAAVVSAAALVALGASMTSMAAGWVQENGLWYYENANGDYVTDEWKRSGDNYFYLGWDGYMLTNQLVQHGDNYYYVDANGAMVKNQWVAVAADDSESSDVDHRWYYFGSTGRAYRSSQGFSKKTVNGQKYAFDEEGKMLYGWVDEGGTELNDDTNAPMTAMYFFGPNDTTTINGVTYTGGAMVTGWYNYLDGLDEYQDEGDDSLWFYFNTSTGAKTANTDNKRIGGLYYSFDENGVMNHGWNVASGSDASESRYFSGSDQGWKQRNTWIWTVPSQAMDEVMGTTDNADDTSRWFYVGSDGKITADEAKRINSKWYIFDEVGRMKSGLVLLTKERIAADAKIDTSKEDAGVDGYADGLIDTEYYEAADIYDLETINLYYFSGSEETDGAMKTGTNVQIELADGTYTFGFKTNGRAMHSVENKKLYNHGILQTGGDMRYAVKVDPEKNVNYVVGPTGTFASENTTVKDADDNYYAITAGHIFKVPADDYASRVARALVTLGKGQDTSLYILNEKEEYVRADKTTDLGKTMFIKVGSDDYVKVTADTYWPSSYVKDADKISNFNLEDMGTEVDRAE